MFKRSYECLYTNQKTQKNKRWKEGSCEIVITGETAKMHLFNNTKKRIESCFVNISNKNEIPEEYTLPNYLVQLNDVNEFEETDDLQIQQKKKNGKEEESQQQADNENCLNKRRIINLSGSKYEYNNKRVKENYEMEKNVSNGIIEGGRENNTNKGIVNTIHKGIFGKNIQIGLPWCGGDIQKFNTPRVIQNTEKKDEKDEQYTTLKHRSLYEKNNQNLNKDTMEKERNKFFSVTYTQKNYFEKKYVKWFDGFVTVDYYNTNETLLTLYDESQKKITHKRMVLPKPDEKECIHVGYYVINNDFNEQSNSLAVPTTQNIMEPLKKYKLPDPYVSPRKKGTKENSRNKQNVNSFEYKEIVRNRNNPFNIFPNVSNKNHGSTHDNSFSNESMKKSTFLEDHDLNCTPKKNDTISIKHHNSNEEEYPIYVNGSKECILFYQKKYIFKEPDSFIEETEVFEDIINIGKFVCKNNFYSLKNFMYPLPIPINENEKDPFLEDYTIPEDFKKTKEEPKIINGGNPRRTIYDYFGTSSNKNNEGDAKNMEKDITVTGEGKDFIVKNEIFNENIKYQIIEECDSKKEINKPQSKDIAKEVTTTNHINECVNNKIIQCETSTISSKILHSSNLNDNEFTENMNLLCTNLNEGFK